jgi:Holliday junction resolvase RusA-like endonuclease
VTAIAFTVYGTAATAGSKRGFYNAKARRVIVTDDNAKSRPWKALVADAAMQAMTLHGGEGSNGYRPPLEGPLLLELTFWIPRPKSHYGSGRNAESVKPGAPHAPAVKPDLLKLARAVEDALTAVVYRDDAQIVAETLQKAYTTGQARTEVRVVTITRGERTAARADDEQLALPQRTEGASA